MEKSRTENLPAQPDTSSAHRDYMALKRHLALQAAREGYSIWEISKRLGIMEAQVDDWLDDLESEL